MRSTELVVTIAKQHIVFPRVIAAAMEPAMIGRLLHRAGEWCSSFLILCVATAAFGADTVEWANVAKHDLTLARNLTNSNIEFGEKFLVDVIGDRVADCRPRPSKIAPVAESEVLAIRVYCEHYCEPWYSAWSAALEPCDVDKGSPDWCKAGNETLAAEHLDVDPYFETLTAAIKAADSSLERFNIMAIAAHRVGHRVLRDFPSARRNAWATDAVTVFLDRARPDEALGIAWTLYTENLQRSSALAGAFRDFADRGGKCSEEQRQVLLQIADGLDGGSVSAGLVHDLRARFGAASRPPGAPMPDRTDAADIAKLLQRVDEYGRLLRGRKYEMAWGMLSVDRREQSTVEEFVRTERYLQRHAKTGDTHVERIQVKGDTAKVFVRGGSVREDATFWIHEGDTWYRVLPAPPFWDIGTPTEVPIPKAASENRASGRE